MKDELANAIRICKEHGFRVIDKDRVRTVGARHVVSAFDLQQAEYEEAIIEHVNDRLARLIGYEIFRTAATMTRQSARDPNLEEFEARVMVVLP